ncbi:MAG: YchJ family protein [Pseudomonadota bacterium]
MSPSSCPCGSAQAYAQCCGPLHRGAAAQTAEALMRSRYSAFVLGLSDYLLSTWHAETRPAHLDLTADDTVWLGLQILATHQGEPGDSRGEVEFVARFQGGQLHERSRFLNEGGQWFYVDGEIRPPVAETKVGRNAPCPCGSGRKFKRCCGQR